MKYLVFGSKYANLLIDRMPLPDLTESEQILLENTIQFLYNNDIVDDECRHLCIKEYKNTKELDE